MRTALARALALGALALGGAGCSAGGTTAGSGSVHAVGHTLKIYASVPGASADPGEQDVFHAEQLALREQRGSVSRFKLSLVEVTSPRVSDDARSAISDTSAIAYLGEIQPGASAGSVGITNALDLLQVSPTDTAVELTQPTPAAPGAPANLLEQISAYGHTFARVSGTTRQEASGLVAAIAARGVHTLYLATDGSVYGQTVAEEVSSAAARQKLTVKRGAATVAGFTGSGADGLLLAGTSLSLAESLLPAVSSAAGHVQLFAPSGLYSPGLAAALNGRVRRLFVSVPGFTDQGLTSQGRAFVRRFTSAFGHAPDPRAIFGYEAMSALISVLGEAGTAADNRARVVKGFLAIKNRSSVLGTYSISGGDTTIAPFILTQLHGGSLVAAGPLPTG